MEKLNGIMISFKSFVFQDHKKGTSDYLGDFFFFQMIVDIRRKLVEVVKQCNVINT